MKATTRNKIRRITSLHCMGGGNRSQKHDDQVNCIKATLVIARRGRP